MAVVEAQDLHRTYRTHTGTIRRRAKEIEAVKRRQLRDPERRALRPARPKRRREDDDDQDADHAAHPHLGSARVLGHDVVKEAREVRKRIGYVFGGERGVYERLSGYDNLRYFAELYGVPAEDPEAADRGAARARRAQGARARAHRGLLARDEAAAPRRPRAAARPRGALPRRADDRPRPGRRARAAVDHRLAHRGRQDDPPDDSLHVRSGRPLRPDRRHLAGQRSSPRARPAS